MPRPGSTFVKDEKVGGRCFFIYLGSLACQPGWLAGWLLVDPLLKGLKGANRCFRRRHFFPALPTNQSLVRLLGSRLLASSFFSVSVTHSSLSSLSSSFLSHHFLFFLSLFSQPSSDLVALQRTGKHLSSIMDHDRTDRVRNTGYIIHRQLCSLILFCSLKATNKLTTDCSLLTACARRC